MVFLFVAMARGLAGATDPLPSPSATVVPAPPEPVFAPPEPEPAAVRQMRAQMGADMQRFAAQMRASQVELRREVLALLGPAQSAMVAATIGQLALSPDGDLAGAARRIDAVLSPAQRGAIAAAVKADESRRQQIFLATVAQTSRSAEAQFRLSTQGQPQGADSGLALPPLSATVPQTQRFSNSVVVGSASGFAMHGPGAPLGPLQDQTAGAFLLEILGSPAGSTFGPVEIFGQH